MCFGKKKSHLKKVIAKLEDSNDDEFLTDFLVRFTGWHTIYFYNLIKIKLNVIKKHIKIINYQISLWLI